MEPQEVSIRAPGSFILIAGSVDVDAPEFDGGPSRLWANAQCVCVGTLCEIDGCTRIVIGSGSDHADLTLVFKGEIDTQSERLVVSDAELNELIEIAAPSRRTGLSIWTNDAREPTVIAIDVT
ncbi:hypothetical protein [Caulobacter endophyticus]|uniref:hypothetical protein n=1 Tax=Caulobacter endophyticus TaxID=2172652 RepID=UPI00240F4BAE|nr:hypothetical protein [Caulobacter endophyticus]MDG2528849.1 hypothetical protein [Caulobacter endophyticus]